MHNFPSDQSSSRSEFGVAVVFVKERARDLSALDTRRIPRSHLVQIAVLCDVVQGVNLDVDPPC